MARSEAVGVDLSTRKLAVVELVGLELEWWEFVATGKRADDRFAELMRDFNGWLYRRPVSQTVFIEGVPFVKNRAGFAALAQVLGGVRAACALQHVECAVVPGYEWKRALGLSGNSGKATVADHVLAREPRLAGTSQDVLDAYGLAVYGRSR